LKEDYFCRDLWTRLEKCEGIIVLENLLKPKHVQQGSRMFAREAKFEWLQCCMQMRTSSLVDDKELAYSLNPDGQLHLVYVWKLGH